MNRISGTLELIRDQLEEYLQNQHPPNDDVWVTLSNLVDSGGAPYGKAADKLVMFLANIARETAISTYNPTRPVAGNLYAVGPPPLYVDLFLLLYANFSDDQYIKGLQVISQVLSFFQQRPTFDHENLPGLDKRIEKLNFELVNLDATELSYLMGLAGTTYLPSAYYKIRLIPYADDSMQAAVPAAAGLEPATGGSGSPAGSP